MVGTAVDASVGNTNFWITGTEEAPGTFAILGVTDPSASGGREVLSEAASTFVGGGRLSSKMSWRFITFAFCFFRGDFLPPLLGLAGNTSSEVEGPCEKVDGSPPTLSFLDKES